MSTNPEVLNGTVNYKGYDIYLSPRKKGGVDASVSLFPSRPPYPTDAPALFTTWTVKTPGFTAKPADLVRDALKKCRKWVDERMGVIKAIARAVEEEEESS
jgi:hypothetical protein